MIVKTEEQFTKEELFKELYDFALYVEYYDVESDDCAEFGKTIWEKIGTKCLKEMIKEFNIDLDVEKLDKAAKEEYDEIVGEEEND